MLILVLFVSTDSGTKKLSTDSSTKNVSIDSSTEKIVLILALKK